MTFDHLPLVFCSPVISEKFGVDSLGNTAYEWVAAAGQIGCPTCATTTYTFPSGAQPGDAVELILLEKTSLCTRKHVFTISFGADFDLMASDQKICRGEKTTLAAQSSAGGTFQWNGPGATGQTGQNLLVAPTQNAFYTVTVTLASGCTGMASVLIEVLPTDSVVLPKIVKCPGDTVIFGQNVSNPGIFFKKIPEREWLRLDGFCGNTVFADGSIERSSHDLFRRHGLRERAASNANEQFSASFQRSKRLRQHAHVHGQRLAKTGHPAHRHNLRRAGRHDHDQRAGRFSSYEWDYPFTNCGGCTSPFFIPDSAGVYVFHLKVTNSGGCSGEIEVVLRIDPLCDPASILIPNAFTPDGDGLNDTFQPVQPEGGESIARLRIYDRWGELIFDKTGAEAAAGWDGKIHGKPAPMDVYVWILDVTCASIGGEGQRVGDVTVIR